jgi:hypothetical protein
MSSLGSASGHCTIYSQLTPLSPLSLINFPVAFTFISPSTSLTLRNYVASFSFLLECFTTYMQPRFSVPRAAFSRLGLFVSTWTCWVIEIETLAVEEKHFYGVIASFQAITLCSPPNMCKVRTGVGRGIQNTRTLLQALLYSSKRP